MGYVGLRVRVRCESPVAVVTVGKGGLWPAQTQIRGGLPIVTNTLTRPNTPTIRHENRPTKPYQDLCSRCETHWRFWFGLPTLTTVPIWLSHRYRIVLPTLTSRGVKYTHDINDTVLHGNRGSTGLRRISQEHIQEVIPVTDGGAQHRLIDTPTPPYNVADPHAVAKVHTVAGPKSWTPRPPQSRRTVLIL
jgi:hypothetical protein